jgi:hypothetical protein
MDWIVEVFIEVTLLFKSPLPIVNQQNFPKLCLFYSDSHNYYIGKTTYMCKR